MREVLSGWTSAWCARHGPKLVICKEVTGGSNDNRGGEVSVMEMERRAEVVTVIIQIGCKPIKQGTTKLDLARGHGQRCNCGPI